MTHVENHSSSSHIFVTECSWKEKDLDERRRPLLRGRQSVETISVSQRVVIPTGPSAHDVRMLSCRSLLAQTYFHHGLHASFFCPMSACGSRKPLTLIHSSNPRTFPDNDASFARRSREGDSRVAPASSATSHDRLLLNSDSV